jgi:hypothetical protein
MEARQRAVGPRHLVWTKAPFFFRNELLLVTADDRGGEVRQAEPGEVSRLGPHPAVVSLLIEGGGRIKVAAAADELVARPFAVPLPEAH